MQHQNKGSTVVVVVEVEGLQGRCRCTIPGDQPAGGTRQHKEASWRSSRAVLEPRWRSHQEKVESTELTRFLLPSSFRRRRKARLEEPTVPPALALKSRGEKRAEEACRCFH